MTPELLTEISYADAGRYVVNPAYGLQRKRDGKHLLIDRQLDGECLVRNKHGQPTTAPQALLKSIPPGIAIDGELEGHMLVAYDLLRLPQLDLRQKQYETRLTLLEELVKLIAFHGAPIVAIETYYGEAKERMLLEAVQLRWEGVVFKNMGALYMPGLAGQHVKLKFVKSCTTRVRSLGISSTDPRLGITSARLEMLSPSGWIEVCGVSLFGREPVQVGQYLEVDYLKASDKNHLIQPVNPRLRDDANDDDCRIEQLVHNQ